MTVADTFPLNPFVGLRPFTAAESERFFGRREQTTQLLERLDASHLVAVLGYSGSGKSSLVLAGLVPKLLGGFLVRDRDRWCVATLRPGWDPLTNIAQSLHAALAASPGRPPMFEELHPLLAAKNVDALVSVVASAVNDAESNLLIVVDQLEELFRFRGAAQVADPHEQGTTFVNAVLGLAEQRAAPVFVVLTMRSDFVGDCAFFPGLPEAVNQSVYLIPRMTKDEFRETIESPVRLAGGAISSAVAERLYVDIGLHPDQLPIVQHALMRTWTRWEDSARSRAIDLRDYDAVGGVGGALNLHVESVFAHLTPDEQRVAERIFKSVTEMGPDNRAIRRPETVHQLCKVVRVDQQLVRGVIDAFRRPDRSFLTPPYEVALQPDSLIDIGHESLIRNWKRLDQWVREEAESSRIYRRLAEVAALNETGRAALYRDPDLTIALQWREDLQPSETWARRYGPGSNLERVIAFLDRSRAARVQELTEAAAKGQSYWNASAVIKAAAFWLGGIVTGAFLTWYFLT